MKKCIDCGYEGEEIEVSDDPFYTVRNYCDKNEIQYRYDSWTSADDMDDIEEFISL